MFKLANKINNMAQLAQMEYIWLKGNFTSGKMNVYLKWVIYFEEM